MNMKPESDFHCSCAQCKSKTVYSNCISKLLLLVAYQPLRLTEESDAHFRLLRNEFAGLLGPGVGCKGVPNWGKMAPLIPPPRSLSSASLASWKVADLSKGDCKRAMELLSHWSLFCRNGVGSLIPFMFCIMRMRLDIRLFGVWGFFCCVSVETRGPLVLTRNLSEVLFMSLNIVLLLEV